MHHVYARPCEKECAEQRAHIHSCGVQAEIAAIDAFNEKLVLAGQRIVAIGIDSPEKSVVIDNREGRNEITEGPLYDSSEYVSGIWIIDVPNHEHALKLASEGSMSCNRRVELRPIFG